MKVFPLWLITLIGCIGVEVSLIFYAWRTGSILLPAVGIVLIPVLVLIQTGIVWLLNWLRTSPK